MKGLLGTLFGQRYFNRLVGHSCHVRKPVAQQPFQFKPKVLSGVQDQGSILTLSSSLTLLANHVFVVLT